MSLQELYWDYCPKWLTLEWYKYLFANNKGLRNIWCRVRGHPFSVGWYNSYGLEPDMHCSNCDEDLG